MSSLKDFMDIENTKDKLLILMQENNIPMNSLSMEELENCASRMMLIMDVVAEKTLGEEEDQYINEAIDTGKDFPFQDYIFGLMDVIGIMLIALQMRGMNDE